MQDAGRVTVLMYHRIGDAQDDWEKRYCISPERFTSHMLALERRGMRPCSIEDFVAWLDGRSALQQGSFLLTFDDGFLGVYKHAFPLLAEKGWSATVFLVSRLIGKKDLWTRHGGSGGRNHPLLGRNEIFEMARAGFSFHSHSRSHPDLRTLCGDALSQELAGARQDLEDLLGRPVTCLAYPYGWYNERVLEAARACGYAAGFSTQPGFNRRDVDRYRIRRLDVYGTDTASALMRKVGFGTNDGSWRQVVRYYAVRAAVRGR